MAERIYLRGEGGELEPLEEERFSTEDDLQKLLANHPELLDGEQVWPENPRRWLLISREMGISEKPEESARWSLDLLLVDQDRIPTLVECKRSTNAEIRRTVVGQLLEYAAHASETWTAEVMRERFEAHCEEVGDDSAARLAALLQTDEVDMESFFQEVARNLDARHMRLLFVADKVPDELLRVIEFLNRQMPDIEVLAITIKQFSGNAGQTLVPRVLGRVASSPRLRLRRETNAVPKLIEAGILADGTQLELRVEALPLAARERVSAWIEEKPNRGRAKWHNDKQGPLEWVEDEQFYSPTGLAQEILHRAADQRPPIAGPQAWRLESGESLAELAGFPKRG